MVTICLLIGAVEKHH